MPAWCPSHPRPLILGILCAFALSVSPTAGQTYRPDEFESSLTVLRDPGAAVPTRNSAADELIAAASRAEPARRLIEILENPATEAETRARLLAAIARAWDPPGRLYPTLAKLAETSDAASAAVAAYRTPVAARTLLSLCGQSPSPAVRDAAFVALVQMTGRDDLGHDITAWATWIDTNSKLRPADWQSTLAEGVWRRAIRLQSDRTSLVDRATEGYRRLYLALPPAPADDRPRLMVQLLSGDQPALRGLAFDLLIREVSAGSPIDPAVCEAAMGLLQHPDAAARAKAAELVLQVAHPEARAKLLQALARERDPAVACYLLPAVTRWPEAASCPRVLSWLATDGECRTPAVQAAYALLAAGLLDNPSDRAAALSSTRRIGLANLPPDGYRVLVELGEDIDRQAIAALLTSPSPSSRLAAADALVNRHEAWEGILGAAKSDPALFEPAVHATLVSHADAEGLQAIEALTAPTPESHRNGILLIAAAVPAADLVRLASRPALEPADRQALLLRLLEHGPSMVAMADETEDVARGLLLLAQTNLKLSHPDQALVALDALPASAPGLGQDELLRTRTICLVWTNHLDQAAALNAPASAWLEALDMATSEPHAREIVRTIRERFSATLTDSERLQLDTLAKRVSVQSPAAPTRATVPDPSDRN